MNTAPPAFCPECGHYLPAESGRYNPTSKTANLVAYKCPRCGAGNTAVDFIDRGLVWFVKPEHLSPRRRESPTSAR